jgi:hypothetical protein
MGSLPTVPYSPPAGVAAPPEVTIAEGQNEVEIDVSATADAPVGQAQVILVATTNIKDKPITVESVPVTLQVAMP